MTQIPDADLDDPKEVFAFFGLAAYKAQVLEQELILLGVALQLNNERQISQDLVDGLFDSLDRKTLGKLLAHARQLTPIPDHLNLALHDALNLRNSLQHGFFARHADDLMSEIGRAEIVSILRDAALAFAETDVELTAFRVPFSESLGISTDAVAMEFEAQLARAEHRDADG